MTMSWLFLELVGDLAGKEVIGTAAHGMSPYHSPALCQAF